MSVSPVTRLPFIAELKLTAGFRSLRDRVVADLGGQAIAGLTRNRDKIRSWNHCEVRLVELNLIARGLPVKIPQDKKLVDLQSLQCSANLKATLAARAGLSDVWEREAVTKMCDEGRRESELIRWLTVQGWGDLIVPGIPFTSNGEQGLIMPRVKMEHCPVSIDGAAANRMIGIGLIHALLHAQDGKRGNMALIDSDLTAFDLGSSLMSVRSCRVPQNLFGNIDRRYHRITLLSDAWNHSLFDQVIPAVYWNRLSDLSESDLPRLREGDIDGLRQRIRQLKALAKGPAVSLRTVFRTLYPEEMLFIEAAKKLGVNTRVPILMEKVLDRALALGNDEQFVQLSKAFQILCSSAVDLEKLTKHDRYTALQHCNP